VVRREAVERGVTISIVILVIIVSGFLLAYRPFPDGGEPERELVGPVYTVSWVPIIIIRDPPGSGGFSKMFLRNDSELTVKFESNSEGVNVSGEYTTNLITDIYYTPQDERSDVVLAKRMNQLWTMWQVTAGLEEWIELELVSSDIVDEGVFRIDELENRSMWTTGPPLSAGEISVGGLNERTFFHEENPWKGYKFTYVRAGYTINTMSVEINIRVLLSVESSTLVTECTAQNTGRISVLCDGPIESQDQGYRCLGLLLWFSQ
jgi:hypothetical protein